jgi:lipoate-protein ligase A
MDPPAWRLLRDPPASASWNMSLDEALLCAVAGGVPVLRFYAWRAPALSLGYRQRPPECPPGRPGVELVRRATGGGTVLHSGDLTYAVVAPAGSPDLPSGLDGSSCWIRDVLIDGLRRAGIDSAPSRPAPDGTRAQLCFAAATGSEIESAGAKLVGSAQRRTAWGLLQHGSLRLRDDGAEYQALLGAAPEAPPAGIGCTREAIEAALVAAFARALGGRLEPSKPSDTEVALARERQRARHLDRLVVPALSSRTSVVSADTLP